MTSIATFFKNIVGGGVKPLNFIGSITFVDGCNNQYTLHPPSANGMSRFVYKPITMEESSSLCYSGGDPGDVLLTSAQVNHIHQLFTRAIQTPSDHASERGMGVAILLYTTEETAEEDHEQRILIAHTPQAAIVDKLQEYFLGTSPLAS